MLLAQILLFGRCTIGIVFALSVVTKLRTYRRFASNLPDIGLPRISAPLVLIAEAAVVASLAIGGAGVPAGLVLALLLLLAFSVALARLVRSGERIPCNCFGADERPVTYLEVWRNALLIACAGLGLAAWGARGAAADTAGPASWPAPALLAVAVGMVSVYLRDVVDIARHDA